MMHWPLPSRNLSSLGIHYSGSWVPAQRAPPKLAPAVWTARRFLLRTFRFLLRARCVPTAQARSQTRPLSLGNRWTGHENAGEWCKALAKCQRRLTLGTSVCGPFSGPKLHLKCLAASGPVRTWVMEASPSTSDSFSCSPSPHPEDLVPCLLAPLPHWDPTKHTIMINQARCPSQT